MKPAIGLNKTSVYANNGWLICEFTRETSMSSQNYYFDLRDQYYILNAYGNMDSRGI
jgi:hypothetical protein